MTLDIVQALKKGAERTFTRNGAIIASLIFVTTIITSVASQSMVKMADLPQSAMQQGVQATPLAIGGPVALHGILMALGALASAVITIAAIRTFTSEETDSLPQEYFTRNIGWVLLNTIVGGIVFGIIVGAPLIGSLGLGAVISSFGSIIPLLIGALLGIAGAVFGVFLAISLLFWNINVAKEDVNFIEAFQESWSMTSGNRINVFALWLSIGAISFVAGFTGGIVSAPFSMVLPALGALVNLAVSAVAAVFGVAVLAQAYNQLH